jgi:hypothetical protein
MMFSNATFDELRQYVGAGHLGQRIALLIRPRTPRLGGRATVEWNFAYLGEERGVLSLPDGSRIAVPPRGRHDFAVNADPVLVSLAVGADVARARLEPAVQQPIIEDLAIPSRSIAGEPMAIRWRIREASAVRLYIGEDDGPPEERHVESAGRMEVVPQRPGAMRVQFEADGPHAGISARARIRIERRVRIAAPQLRINIPKTIQRVPMGNEAEFTWAVTGASEVLLRAAGRELELAVPASGSVYIEAGTEPEVFEIVATGLDGKRHRKPIRIVPMLLGVNEPTQLLAALQMPWR